MHSLLSGTSQIFTQADPHEVSDYVNAHVGAHSIEMPRHGQPLASLEHRRFAGIDLCQLSYGGQVRVSTTSLDTIYHLQILLSGQCQWSGREGEHLFVPGELMVINPDEPVRLTYSQDCRKLIVKLPMDLLAASSREQRLHPGDGGIRFTRTRFSLPGLAGLGELIGLLCLEAESAALPPPLQACYARLLSGKLLSLLPHNGIVLPTPGSGSAFERLLAHIDAHLDQEFTVAQMAGLAGTSERSLYGLFERHTGHSPLHHVRQRKLQRVHALLSDPTGSARSVTEVALDHGFLNPGRFAKAYREVFGELPSQTWQRYRPPLR